MKRGLIKQFSNFLCLGEALVMTETPSTVNNFFAFRADDLNLNFLSLAEME